MPSGGSSVTHSQGTSALALGKFKSQSVMARMLKVCDPVPARIQQSEKKYCIVLLPLNSSLSPSKAPF